MIGLVKKYLMACLIISLLLVFYSISWDSAICFTCDTDILLLLVSLHLILIIATLSANRPIILLAFALFVFYTSRVLAIQLFPESYTYLKYPLTLDDMRESIFVLLMISVGLLLGCLTGYKFGGIRKNNRPFTIFPFEEKISNLKSFYYLITLLFIVTTVIRLILVITTGVGLPIGVQFFSPVLLRSLKASSFLGFFGIVPFIWFILKRPEGFERRLTIFAIVLYILSVASTLSKFGLLAGLIPIFLVYYITGVKIPSRTLSYLKAGLIVSLVLFVVLQSLRGMILASFMEGGGGSTVSVGDALSQVSISSTFINPMGRIWSSFDVLSAVIKNKAAFLPFLNFYDELLDVVNGYVPGGIFPTNAPQFTQLLPYLLHAGSSMDASYEVYLLARTGENITIPAHLYVYLGVFGAATVSFIFMLLFGFIYRHSDSLFVKILVSQIIINDISNSSGIIGPVQGIFQIFVIIYLFIYLHKIARMFSGFRVREHKILPHT